MNLLIIDTSTERGSVSFFENRKLIVSYPLPFGAAQSKELMPSIEKIFLLGKIDLIGVTIGPGSYTGIRVGVAAAQSLAYSRGIPIIPISSLVGFGPSKLVGGFTVIVDARIGGVYMQKGACMNGKISYEPEPQLRTVEEAALNLEEASLLISPQTTSLISKFRFYEKKWIWEEKSPDPSLYLQAIENYLVNKPFFYSPSQLPIYYLRETQAEQEKRARDAKVY